MEQQVIFVMTHDSIGLGEDGPTHQPIEQLEGLRAIPNLNVFRPADRYETIECWELANSQHSIVSYLSAGLNTFKLGIALRPSNCSIG